MGKGFGELCSSPKLELHYFLVSPASLSFPKRLVNLEILAIQLYQKQQQTGKHTIRKIKFSPK
jgi:hypothetical protein